MNGRPPAHPIASLLMRYRHWLVWALLAVAAGLLPGLWQTGFDSQLAVLLPGDDPMVSERQQLQSLFPEQQQVSFVFVPQDGNVFTPATLRALAQLQLQYREIPYARRIASLLNYDSPYGEVSIVPWPWRDFERFTPAAREEMRHTALNDPLVRNTLISGDARLTLATVTLSLTDADTDQNRAIAEAVEGMLQDLRAAHPSVAIGASAEALFEHGTRQAMISDLTRLLPLTMLLCVLFIGYCFHSLRAGLTVFGVAVLTVAMTVATLGWIERPFNTVSIMAPLVVVIVAVADAVHILSIYRQQLLKGRDRHHAMRDSLAFNLRPVTLATLTTGIGFASLMLVSAPALSQFGATVALGVVYAWLVTMTLLPALVPALCRPGPFSRATTATRLTSVPLQVCRRLADRHDRQLFAAGLIAGLTGLLLLPLNETDFNRMDFVDRDSVAYDYYELVEQHMDRGPRLTYGIRAPSPGDITDPALLDQVDDFAQALRQMPGVRDVASLVELIRAVDAALPAPDTARNDDRGRIPDSPQAIRQHLRDYEAARNASYPLSDFVDDRLQTMRLFVSTRQLSNQELVELDSRIQGAFGQRLPDAQLLQGSGTLLFARMDETVTRELLQGYGISVLLITVTLMLGLRSIFYGLISVLPNIMPAVIVFGFRGLFNAQIDPFVLMLFSVSIGLVVDDTVHILSNYLRQRRRGRSWRTAVDTAIFRAGPALLITTFVLTLGATVLLAASTLYFQQAARLLVPIVLLALLLDLLFLPGLLRRLESRFRPAV